MTGTGDTKKTAIHSIAMVVLFFAQWLISMLLVRIGGYYDAGVFSLAMTVSNVFTYIANFGIRSYMLTNKTGIVQPHHYQSAALISISGSFLLCIGYLLIAGQYIRIEKEAIFFYLVYSNSIACSEIMFGRLQLAGHLEINGESNLVRAAVCFAAFVGSFLIFHRVALSLLFMAGAAVLVCVLFDGTRYRKIIGENFFAFRPDFRSGLKILASCIPIMLTSVVPLLTTAIPRTTIQKELGTELLGYFATIFTPTVLITVLVPTVMQALLPSLADNWENNRGLLKKQILKGYGFIPLLAGVALLAALVAGKPVMALLFGEEILPYFSLLYWAILTTCVNAAVMIGNNILIAIHKNRDLLISNLLAFVLCAALSQVFVTHWGLQGAVYVLLCAYGVQVVYQLIVIFCNLHRKNDIGE